MEFPKPEGFVQSLRQRIRGLDPDVPLLIVEGGDDRLAIFPFLTGGVIVVPAGGKENALAAYTKLERKFRRAVVFVIDCDSQIESGLKGKIDLVLTTNRDIQADLVLELRALKRVASEFLASRTENPSGLSALLQDLFNTAASLAVQVGTLQTAARVLGLRTRKMGKSRSGGRIHIFDLPSVEAIADGSLMDLESLGRDMARLTGWSEEELDAILSGADALLKRPCEHAKSVCESCGQQAYANGHHLIDSLACVLQKRYGVSISASDMARAVRLGADRSLVEGWAVAQRLRRWETQTGLMVLAP